MVGVLDARDGRFADLREVEAADVRGHADGDAHVCADKHIREGRGQKRRLEHAAVVVIDKIHGVAGNVPKQLSANGRELGLRITAGGIGHVARIDLAEVALGIDKGREQRFVALAQTHHRLINGGVAVGIELHRLPDDVGALGARLCEQPHVVHRVEQLAVAGLEAVNLRNRARDDDAHGVGHIVRLERFGDGLLQNRAAQSHDVGVFLAFDALGGFFLFRHGASPAFR